MRLSSGPEPYRKRIGPSDNAKSVNIARRLYSYRTRNLLMPFVIMLMLTIVGGGTSAQEKPPLAAEKRQYPLSTPQVESSLNPLAHVGMSADKMNTHAAIVTVADPLETHLAHMFDAQIASLIRAFHVKGYVLDGFAMPWDIAGSGVDTQSAGTGVVGQSGKLHRDMPGVLVFRRDLWRMEIAAGTVGVEYVVVFVVGESPTFGVQPEAFERALILAAEFDGSATHSDQDAGSDCSNAPTIECDGERKTGANTQPSTVAIIGPTFSGSMQSLAAGIGRHLREWEERGVAVSVTSPSATVKSNDKAVNWSVALADGSGAGSFAYRTLAASLEDQLRALCNGIPSVHNRRTKKTSKIVILTEESTFGRGVYDILDEWKKSGSKAKPQESTTYTRDSECNGEKDCLCAERIRVTQFPQNISAIREEHSGHDKEERKSLRKLTQSKSKLLELDLSSINKRSDRPPPYDRVLSSRTDELMLYGTFDALNVHVEPIAVAIVATDVRDRLFLLNEVRKNLPLALPVLLELDFLSAHPDYRKISRGAVVIPGGEARVKLNTSTGREISRRKPTGSGTATEAMSGLSSLSLQLKKRVASSRRGNQASGKSSTAYYSFPSDYAANMFRAALAYIRTIQSPSGNSLCDTTNANGAAPCKNDNAVLGATGAAYTPTPVVTTLAGFQEIASGRSTLLAADSRLSLRIPVYLVLLGSGVFLSLVACWLRRNARESHLSVYLGWGEMTSCLLGKPSRQFPRAVEDSGSAHWTRWAPWCLALLSAGLLLIAAVQLGMLLLFRQWSSNWNLSHGRDLIALLGLSLIYAVLALIGCWRLGLWRARYNSFMCNEGIRRLYVSGTSCDTRESIGWIEWVSICAILIVLLLLSQEWIIRMPVSVDTLWPPVIMSLLILPIGVWFLFQFRKQWKNWAHLAMLLGHTMGWVTENLRKGNYSATEQWPSLSALNELPQTPFNLRFRWKDLAALDESREDMWWVHATRKLQLGTAWPFTAESHPPFEQWQARLVAEMRLASVAVRTCAWCAILAPTTVLLGMSVYPAPWERLQTLVSVTLIVAAFMLVSYVVLRLERIPLLGRMFTEHGDNLSLSGAVGALWPKMMAAALILVPALFPDSLDWLYSLLRSINSLG